MVVSLQILEGYCCQLPMREALGAAFADLCCKIDALNPSPRRHLKMLVGCFATEPCVDHGRADREVVDILKARGIKSEGTMHLVVEVAANAGTLNTGSFSLQIEGLAEHAGLPKALAVAPRVRRADVIEARQHGQGEGGIGSDALMA